MGMNGRSYEAEQNRGSRLLLDVFTGYFLSTASGLTISSFIAYSSPLPLQLQLVIADVQRPSPFGPHK